MDKFRKSFLLFAVLNFTLFIYLPSDSYMGNTESFRFGYHMFIFMFAGFAAVLSVTFAIISSVIPDKIYRAVSGITAGLTFCFYIQYMFFNGYLPELDGSEIDWDRNIGYGVITLIILAGVLFFTTAAALKRQKFFDKVILKISAAVGAVQAVSLAFLIVASGKLLETDTAYFSGSEQYTVSSKENIIVFVLDAVDNGYIKTVLEDSPQAFDGYGDFTLYTNTCTVFSFSDTSFTQLFTGAGYESGISVSEWQKNAWNSESAADFYDRLHSAGYTVNGYSLEAEKASYCLGKLDNCISYDSKDSADFKVNYGEIFKNLNDLTFFRALPYLLKRFTPYREIDFSDCITYDSKVYYENNEFRDNLELKLSESDNKYFVFIHLDGAHQPCPDYIERTRELLRIIGEYIDELRRLGVYDSSDIIITADHGSHSSDVFASTPMLMIKRKNENGTEMRLDASPVYHADFRATILSMAGLYDDSTDSEEYGCPYYYFKEDDIRERIWYEKRIDRDDLKYNSMDEYYGFKYTGDTDELERVVKEEYGIE